MTVKITLPLLIAATLALGACKKKEDPAPAAVDSSAASAAPAPAADTASAAPSGSAAAGDDDVMDYPDETPMSGTVEVLRDFAVHTAADPASKTLSHVGRGTLINLKASHSNWMKIEYPVGVGELGPGWIELKQLGDPRVKIRRDNPLAKHRVRPPRKHRPHR